MLENCVRIEIHMMDHSASSAEGLCTLDCEVTSFDIVPNPAYKEPTGVAKDQALGPKKDDDEDAGSAL